MPRKLSLFDSKESMIFTELVTQVQTDIYGWENPEVKHRRLIPVQFASDPGINAIESWIYHTTGMWKIISGSAQDLPRIDKHATKVISTAAEFAAEYGYSFNSLRSAKRAGIDLDAHKAEAAKRTHSQKESELAWLGDETHNIKGFLAPDNAIEVTLPADGEGNKASLLAKKKLPEKILRDLDTLANMPIIVSKGTCTPDTLILPVEEYRVVATTRDAVSRKSLLTMFLESNDHIKTVEYVAGMDNVDGKRIYQCYHKDPSSVRLHIIMDFFQHEPEKRSLELLVSCEAKMAGVELRRPLSCAWAKITP